MRAFLFVVSFTFRLDEWAGCAFRGWASSSSCGSFHYRRFSSTIIFYRPRQNAHSDWTISKISVCLCSDKPPIFLRMIFPRQVFLLLQERSSCPIFPRFLSRILRPLERRCNFSRASMFRSLINASLYSRVVLLLSETVNKRLIRTLDVLFEKL